MQEILKKIRAERETLAPSQRTVADFVLSHYKDVPFLAVTALADKIGVSDTTVIHFCTRLGFSGYAAFRKALSEQVQSEITLYSKLNAQSEKLGQGGLLDQVLADEKQNLELTLNDPHNRQNMETLLGMIESAKTLYICGFRSASMQAEFLAQSLRMQNRQVVLLTPGNGDYTDKLSCMTKDDLFLCFVFSRYSEGAIKSLGWVHRESIPCAAITDERTSPAFGLADCALLCKMKSSSYQGSYVACSALCNAIITGTSLKRKKQTTQALERLEGLFAEFGTFYR